VLELDNAALAQLVAATTGNAIDAVTPMTGGASTRRYLRVSAGDRRLVAMFVPDARSEEAGVASPTARWPFLEVLALLKDAGVSVPRLVGEACHAGLCLLEDLGDDTLGRFIARAPERREEVYRIAVRDLARAQRALTPLSEGSVVTTRAFDEALLRWELDHFREWGLDARGKALAPAQRAAFEAVAERLARTIAAWPRGFVHRDYQSSNLMVRETPGAPLELVWLDFQDALLGPSVYDLVALLNDSYVDLERDFVEARLADYAEEAGLPAGERGELVRRFDLMTVQRKLKDAGRFVFIDRVKRNPAFLRFVDPSLAKVRTSLTQLADEPDMATFASLIAHA
jgi:hypothetical protein